MSMAGWHHDSAQWAPKGCKFCGTIFTPNSGAHVFCSNNCRGRWRMHNINDTTTQYKLISGNWKRYFSRLCQPKHRKGVITSDDCLSILEAQGGRCALTGEPMTCKLERGVLTLTNASLDRIDAGGTYAPSNVQLVCAVVNQWRGNVPIPEYIAWCKKVVDYAIEK